MPGGYYAILETGPKVGGLLGACARSPHCCSQHIANLVQAFDPVNRRAFYMLATGPFAEFDVVAVNVDAVPPTLAEAPSLCGFIGAFWFLEPIAFPPLPYLPCTSLQDIALMDLHMAPADT